MLTVKGAKRHIGCVLLEHFRWHVGVKSNPELRSVDRPVFIASPGSSKDKSRTVLDTSPGVQGVLYGMTIEQAISRVPDAVVVDADQLLAEKLFDSVVENVWELTPKLETPETGRIYLDLSGLDRLHGDDRALVKLISGSVRLVTDFDVKIGIGPSKWLALMAARRSRDGFALKVSGGAREFMSPLPVNALPLTPDLVERISSFGFGTFGAIADVPRSAFHAQFGINGAIAWDLANGIDNSPLIPLRARESVSESMEFTDPTVNLFTIVAGLDSLLRRAYSRHTLKGSQTRRCDVVAQVFRSAPWVFQVAFKQPARSFDDALFAIKAKLDTMSVPGPITELQVTLTGITGDGGRQESMWQEEKRANDLSEMLASLEERIGCTPPIYRVETIKPDSKVPEWRNALVQLSR